MFVRSNVTPSEISLQLLCACIEPLAQEWPHGHLHRALMHPQGVKNVCANGRLKEHRVVHLDRRPQPATVVVLDAGAFRRAYRAVDLAYFLAGEAREMHELIGAIDQASVVRVDLREYLVHAADRHFIAHGLPPVLPMRLLFGHDFARFRKLLMCPVCKALERADHHRLLTRLEFAMIDEIPISRQYLSHAVRHYFSSIVEMLFAANITAKSVYTHSPSLLSYRPCWLPFFQVQDDIRVRLIVVAHPAYPVGVIAIHHAHRHTHVGSTPPAHVRPALHTWIERLSQKLLVWAPRAQRHRHIGQPCDIIPGATAYEAALAVGCAGQALKLHNHLAA